MPDALHDYAARAARTWVDAWLLSGSTTRGDLLTTLQRGQVIDMWLSHLPADRLIACCWSLDDVAQAAARGVAPMMVLRDLPDPDAALALLAELPQGALIYSHPMYTATTFDADLAAVAAAAGVLPVGGKIAKVSPAKIAAITAATGAGFAFWDGSTRHIADSVAAGAAGVIATPLSWLPDPFPARQNSELQLAFDETQAALDALAARPQRKAYLEQLAFRS
ncbi:hypothetical protein [Actinoplanes sp. NPDC026619]|uniref:hypothetical protein n=1 Tax=Actinoplanes sp. NPDC026619 TaxID=3155798 RepID=UPI0034018877